MKIIILALLTFLVVGCQSTSHPAKPKRNLCIKKGQPITRAEPIAIVRVRRNSVNRTNTPGYVKLRFNVDSDGSTKNIQIIESKPSGFFDDVSIKSLKYWKYLPACDNGVLVSKPVETTLRYDGDKN